MLSWKTATKSLICMWLHSSHFCWCKTIFHQPSHPSNHFCFIFHPNWSCNSTQKIIPGHATDTSIDQEESRFWCIPCDVSSWEYKHMMQWHEGMLLAPLNNPPKDECFSGCPTWWAQQFHSELTYWPIVYISSSCQGFEEVTWGDTLMPPKYLPLMR